jgi:molybdate transport system ATP-binding protein
VTGVTARIVVRRGAFVLDADLDLPRGRTTALLGPNGAGKSTALAALAGIVPLDAGRIELDGRVLDDAADVFVPAADRRVGMVFQDGLLFPHLTVLDNVAFGPRSRGAPRARARRTARDWLERLGVGDLAGRRPGALSGGQAQRVALARALAGDPRLLLLDEPLSALDVGGRVALRHTLADHLGDLDAPRLLVTHDPLEAFLLADRIAVVEDGRVTQTGTPDEIRLHPRTPYAADLAGANLLRGTAADGVVDVAGFALHVADTTTHGPVVVTIHARAIALARERPSGSHRNTWQSTVDRIEHLGDRVRLRFGAPLPVTAEVTPGATRELGLDVGAPVWLAVKATEVIVSADE